jgi:hypothetical protein
VLLTDDQHMQADMLLAAAIGGARVLVREHDVARANDILAAFERGDLALSDDADVGAPAVGISGIEAAPARGGSFHCRRC